jgi:hypothetical protein
MAWSLLTTSPIKLVLYGGAAGGGKTWLGCLWQIAMRLNYPNTRGFIGRTVLSNLMGTTIKTFNEVAALCGLRNGIDYYINQQSKEIKFTNGSEIIFRDLAKNPSDPLFERLGGLEITDAFIDEASEVDKIAVEVLGSRIRYRNAELNIKPKLLLTCNPAKTWLYTDFWKPFKSKTIAGNSNPFIISEEKAFIQAFVSDNPNQEFVNQYTNNLNSLKGVNRQRLLFGDWDYSDDDLQLIKSDHIINFFTNTFNAANEKDMYLTCDVARFGSDKTVIIEWSGYAINNIHTFSKQDLTGTANFINQLKDKYNIGARSIVIDSDGVGGGVVDMVKGCLSFVANSRPINEKGKQPNYSNLKAQCTYRMADAFSNNKLSIQPNLLSLTVEGQTLQEVLNEELAFIKMDKVDKDGKLFIEPKEAIKKQLGRSPDYADAIMMRFHPRLSGGGTRLL